MIDEEKRTETGENTAENTAPQEHREPEIAPEAAAPEVPAPEVPDLEAAAPEVPDPEAPAPGPSAPPFSEPVETPVPDMEETVYPAEPPLRQPQEAPPAGAPWGWSQPPYGAPVPQQPPYPPVYQPPVYQQPPVWNGGTGYYPYYSPYPPKKKMSTGLKVFIWIASILAGLAILGFAAYLTYQAVTLPLRHSYSENHLPYGWKESPYEFPLPRDPESPDESEAPDEDETPDFDDGVTPPDTDDPLPSVDVTPNHEGITIHRKLSGEPLSAQEVYQKVVKSTVTVAVVLERNGQEANSTGTGIIATSDGYIITNAHVVLNSKSSRVKITTNDGQEYDAVVVGTDRTTDLAVLKTNDHNFSPAEFGDADELVVGDPVIAIGNPGGAKFSGSLTGGYVSGLDRAVGKYSENGMTYLQTDAAINPGNSGGPLVNMYGQVVGINSSKIITDGYEGMGFAIPVSKAQSIINQLLSGGYVKGRVRLGITGSDTQNNAYYTFSGMPQGFQIAEIGEGSAFTGTDAQVGDVITALDGKEVTCLDEISNLLLKYEPGDKVTVTLFRPKDNDEFQVEITLLEDKGETQQ